MDAFFRYLAAETALNEGLIRTTALRGDGPPAEQGPERLHIARAFLAACGNPQQGIPVVYVTGTSGKGSVSAAVAWLLRAAGYRVALHVSPYLQAATEKIWIDGAYVSAAAFADLADWVFPIARDFLRRDVPVSVHGMAQVAVFFEAARRAEVDVAVVEAGCGGRYDLANVGETAVAVITNVGWDHQYALGGDLTRIAWHKAGAARPRRPLVTSAAEPALSVILEEARALGCPVHVCTRPQPAAANAAAALAAAAAFSGRSQEDLRPHLPSRSLLPGRAERMPGSPPVLLDGAHNEDKLRAAAAAAVAALPGRPRIAVVGMLGSKASAATVAPIAQVCDAVVCCAPQVYQKSPCPPEELAGLFTQLGCPATVVSDPHQALDTARDRCGDRGGVWVTGSFYLCGTLRERWYPKEAVVRQRTSWPRSE